MKVELLMRLRRKANNIYQIRIGRSVHNYDIGEVIIYEREKEVYRVEFLYDNLPFSIEVASADSYYLFLRRRYMLRQARRLRLWI